MLRNLDLNFKRFKNRGKKHFKSSVALVLSFVIAFSALAIYPFNTEVEAYANNGGQTKYPNISKFQDAEWAKIQSAVFSNIDTTSPKNPSDLITFPNRYNTTNATVSVTDDNPYFTWTETNISNSDKYTGTSSSPGYTTVNYSFKDSDKTTTQQFRKYDVSNASQFRYAMEQVAGLTSTSYGIMINMTADIDLNGANYNWKPISCHKKTNSVCYIEGNGHTIYNMKIYNETGYPNNTGNQQYVANATGMFSVAPAYFAVKNLGFKSSMILNNGEGSFSTQAGLVAAYVQKKIYFYNVHSDTSFFNLTSRNTSGAGGLIGRKQAGIVYNYEYNGDTDYADFGDNFFKNCSVEKCYMYGGDHLGGFSCYMGIGNFSLNEKYNADFPETPEAYVFTPIATTRSNRGQSVTGTCTYPIMVENCYSIDGTIFSTGHDSGAFISCGDNIISRNSFTNNNIYAKDNTGGFIGRLACKNSNDTTGTGGVMRDDNTNTSSSKNRVAGYFENCYSSGIVEGVNAMGGFIGVDNTYRAQSDIELDNGDINSSRMSAVIYKNCYSTSMVGMDYAGKYCGGFIGMHDNYSEGTIVNIEGTNVEGDGSFFINCYAAGEVGNILTVTNKNLASESEDIFFNDETKVWHDGYYDWPQFQWGWHEGYWETITKDHSTSVDDVTPENIEEREVLNYYPTGGFAGVLSLDNYTYNSGNPSGGYGNFYNCFYDKQTTAMREMAVGLEHLSVSSSGDNNKTTTYPDDTFSLPGVTGLYTQESEVKGVKGLTTMTEMDSDKANSTTWEYNQEYYPQLSCFMYSDIEADKIEDIDSDYLTKEKQIQNNKIITDSPFFIEDSKSNNNDGNYSKPVLSLVSSTNTSTLAAQMALLVNAYRYSQASTATVLLDHWDYIMNLDTGGTSEDANEWTGLSDNRFKKYYVIEGDNDTATTVAYVKYFRREEDRRGNVTYVETEYPSLASRVCVYSQATGAPIAYLHVYSAKSMEWRVPKNPEDVLNDKDKDYTHIDSEFDATELKNTVEEYRLTITGMEPGVNYSFKVKEGIGNSYAYNFGLGGFNDTTNFSLSSTSLDSTITVRFRCDGYDNKAHYYLKYEDSNNPGKVEVLANTFGKDVYKERDIYMAGLFNWDANNVQMDYIGDKKYSKTFTLEPGFYNFKITNGTWNENYGQNGKFNGPNMEFTLSESAEVTFVFTDINLNENSAEASEAIRKSEIIVNPPEALESSKINDDEGSSGIDFEGYSLIAPSVITGHNWLGDNSAENLQAAKDGEMKDPDGDGWYEVSFTVRGTENFNKNYAYKVIENAIDKGANKFFYLESRTDGKDYTVVTFHYNPELDETYVTTDFQTRDQVQQFPTIDNYYIAGSFNPYYEWLNGGTVDFEKMKMTWVADMDNGTYSWSSRDAFPEALPANTYQLKVVGNGTWDSGVDYGDPKTESGNFVFTTTESAYVTVYFNRNTGTISVVTDPVSALKRTEYVVTGTTGLMGLNWDVNAAVMTYDETTGDYFYIIENVSRGKNYAYKVILKGEDSGDENITFGVLGDADDKPVNIKVIYEPDTGHAYHRGIDPVTGEDITDEVITSVVINFWSVLGDYPLTGFTWGSDANERDEYGNDAATAGKMSQTTDIPELEGYESTDEVYFKDYTVYVPSMNDDIATYSFKIVVNGDWDAGVNYGVGGLNGGNVVLNVRTNNSVSDTCTLTVYFNYTKGRVDYILSNSDYIADKSLYLMDWVLVGERGIQNPSSKKVGYGVYDTVRDITKVFKFTSGAGSEERGLSWTIDYDLNESYEFINEIDFPLDYDVQGNDVTTEFKETIVDINADAEYDENTPTGAVGDYIVRYTADKFAPGKQWLTVSTIGYGFADVYGDWLEDQIAYTNAKPIRDAISDSEKKYYNALVGYKDADDKYISQETDNLYSYLNYLKYDKDGKERDKTDNLRQMYDTFAKDYGNEAYGGGLLEMQEYLKNACDGDAPESTPDISSQNIQGTRNIRMIPTAYLEAGVDARISVIQSEDGTPIDDVNSATNIVRYDNYAGYQNINTDDNTYDYDAYIEDLNKLYFTKYNYALSAGYLISDIVGLGIYKNYNEHVVQKYPANSDASYKNDTTGNRPILRDDQKIENRVDYTFFALSSTYTESAKYTDSGHTVGPNGNGLQAGKLVQQSLIGTSYYADSTTGQPAMTVVKVNRIDDNGNVSAVFMDSSEGAEGSIEYRNYLKWSGGDEVFTLSDVGTYEVVYQWALADGRYMSDSKYVYINSLKAGIYKTTANRYMAESDETKEIKYTIEYSNDRTNNSLNFSILDILPFNGDTRKLRAERANEDPLHTNNSTNTKIKVKSVNIYQNEGAQIYGLYYTTDPNIQSWMDAGTTDNPNPDYYKAAANLGLTANGKISSDLNLDDRTGNKSTKIFHEFEKTGTTYSSGVLYTIPGEDASNVTGIAITGNELGSGRTLKIEITIEADFVGTDVLVNNAFYQVTNAESDESLIEKSDFSSPATTYVIARSVQGYAWIDINKDGKVDAFEPRLKNLEVALFKESDGKWIDSGMPHCFTGSNGFYEFTNVKEGDYRIVFLDPTNGSKLCRVVGEQEIEVVFDNLTQTTQLSETNYSGLTGSRNLIRGTDSYTDGNKTIKYFYINEDVPETAEVYNRNLENALNTYISDDYLYTKYYQNGGFGLELDFDYGLDIHKVGVHDVPLEGVKFMLEYKVNTYGWDSSGNELVTENWYPVYRDLEDGKLKNDEKTIDELEQNPDKYQYVFSTDGNGDLSFDDLFAADFRLTELETAPDYFKLTAPFTFSLPYTVNKADYDSSNSMFTFSEDNITYEDDETISYSRVGVKIVNSRQFTLPNAGFDGLFIIVLVGLAAFGAAMLMFYLSRKKKSKGRQNI